MCIRDSPEAHGRPRAQDDRAQEGDRRAEEVGASMMAAASTGPSQGDYVRAVLNILDDFADEKQRLEQSQKAMLNILDDSAIEKEHLEDMQRAVLNICLLYTSPS